MSGTAYVWATVLPMTLAGLPTKFDSPAARAMLMAIGLQESRFEYRRQINGPARGFWQFEKGGGVRGVLRHDATRAIIHNALAHMAYDDDEDTSHAAIEHNDLLACTYARLLLWTHPKALPMRGEPEAAWNYYVSTWRPGKPHRQTWNAFYEQAWSLG